jgi:hypothetical protein
MRLNAPRATCAVSVLRAGGQGQVMPAIDHMIRTEAVTEIVLRFYSFIYLIFGITGEERDD